jgi:hypothetical protein
VLLVLLLLLLLLQVAMTCRAGASWMCGWQFNDFKEA